MISSTFSFKFSSIFSFIFFYIILHRNIPENTPEHSSPQNLPYGVLARKNTELLRPINRVNQITRSKERKIKPVLKGLNFPVNKKELRATVWDRTPYHFYG